MIKKLIITLLFLFAIIHIESSPSKLKVTGNITFIKIDAGIFNIGSPQGLGYFNERPKTQVKVDSFWISKFEITQKLYSEIMNTNPSSFNKGGYYPVENVSWYEAMQFCEKFGQKYNIKIRLPYEIEWEYACKAGSNTQYFWGDSINPAYLWYNMNSDDDTHPVGVKLPNRWGLNDMLGNVSEWCMDWYSDNYVLPKGPEKGIGKIVKGGSWSDDEYNLRSSFRTSFDPDSKYFNIGFRVVIDQ